MVCPTHLVVRSFPGFSLQKCRNSRGLWPTKADEALSEPRLLGRERVHYQSGLPAPSLAKARVARQSASRSPKRESRSRLGFCVFITFGGPQAPGVSTFLVGQT